MTIKKIAACLATAVLIVGLATACSATGDSESTGQYIDSSVITAKVKAALIDDPDVNALQVEVETYKDRVLLSGFVDSEEERQKAAQVAASIDGVREVENNIEVK